MSDVAANALAGPAREELRRQLLGLGFDTVRFAAVGGPGPAGLPEWLAAGCHADMAWMERSVDKRGDARLVLPGARSVIMLGVNYWPGEAVNATWRGAGRPHWARYALHEDYHDTIKAGLVGAGRVLEQLGGLTGEDYRYYTDTGPVMERGWAARAGLGFRGKNGMLISRQHGNWLLLATILTRLEIVPDASLRRTALADGVPEPAGLLCGKCTRCLDACPTQAFAAPGIVDARRCVSYQTIENKGVIPRELRAGIGARIFGCDGCLEVCPWNRFAQEGRRLLVVARHDLADLSLAEILALTPERFAEVFRRTPVKRLKLTGLLRNACVVAGNSGDPGYVPVLVQLATHAVPLVRGHAVWAVRRLAGADAPVLLQAARRQESEAAVLAEYEAPGV